MTEVERLGTEANVFGAKDTVATALSQPAIEVRGLSKTYRHRRGLLGRVRVATPALNDVNLHILRGELFGLLGPNGAGKTTTVKVLTTLLIPDSGTARIWGMDVVRNPQPVRKIIGFTFGGERGLYWRLSGFDNLRYFADLYGVSPEITRKRVPELLEAVGIRGREHEPVERYSRGMKQRLHLARCLINNPRVLFLDEP